MTRRVDARGGVSFAGAMYQAGYSHRGESVEVSIVGNNVQLSKDANILNVHPIRHDRTKEHGAFAVPRSTATQETLRLNPQPRCRTPTEHALSHGYRTLTSQFPQSGPGVATAGR